MSQSEEAELTGNDEDSDVASDDQQGGSYWEVVGKRKKNSKQDAAYAIPISITTRQPQLDQRSRRLNSAQKSK